MNNEWSLLIKSVSRTDTHTTSCRTDRIEWISGINKAAINAIKSFSLRTLLRQIAFHLVTQAPSLPCASTVLLRVGT